MFKIIIVFFIIIFNSGYFAQWSLMPSSPSGFVRNILIYGDTVYLAHTSSGVYRSIDGTATFQQMSNGLTSDGMQVYEITAYNNNLYAATTGGIYKSTDFGVSWTKKSNGITIGPGATKEFCESIFEYNGVLFTGAWNGIYSSGDEAENWMISNATGSGISAKNFTAHNSILFAARESINTPAWYKSTDGGSSWLGMGYTPLFNTITFLSEPIGLWVGTIHGVWFSTDDGNTWNNRSTGLSLDPYNTSIIRVNGVLITSLHFGGSGIYASSNNGLLWEDFADGLPFLNNIEKLVVYGDKILAATSQGVWQRNISDIVPVELISFSSFVDKDDVSLSWVTASEINNRGFEIQRLNDPKISEMKDWVPVGFVEGNGTSTEQHSYSYADKNLSAGKYLYRIKQIDFDGSFEYYSLSPDIIIGAPEKFKLEQNYPNPFNPATVIKYNLPYDANVNLKVYDVLGNEVATLVNENKEAGDYTITFNAINLSSGIYFYRIAIHSDKLVAGDIVELKKMALVR
jgi:hypothetical protein